MQAASSPHTRLFPVTRLAILGIASSAIALCCITSPSHAQFGKFLDKAKDAAKKVVPGSASGNAEEPTPSESTEPTSRSEATGAEPETAEPETELVIDLSLPEWRHAPEMTAVSDPEGQFKSRLE